MKNGALSSHPLMISIWLPNRNGDLPQSLTLSAKSGSLFHQCPADAAPKLKRHPVTFCGA
jgi:hypothetical protein